MDYGQLTLNIPMDNICLVNPHDGFGYLSENWNNPFLL